MAGLAERHRSVARPIGSATELLRVASSMLAALLVLYRSPLFHLKKMINDPRMVHCLNPKIMATWFPH
jgi:hypothetical protein